MMSRAGMHATLAQNAQELSPWLLVAAAGFVALLALLVASPLLRRRTIQKPTATESPAEARGADGRPVERDLRELMRELSEMTRRSTAQFDARAARLEQLIRAADERLAKLTSAMTPPASTPASTEGDGDGQHETRLIESTPTAPAPPEPSSSPSEDAIDPRHVEIYTLCEQGLSIPQIADRLRRPSGEIELIIALRPRNKRTTATGAPATIDT
jgi:hypothetical protein